MKLKQFLVSILVASVLVSNAVHATDWDWGGYVAVADSPVIGGFAVNEVKSCQNINNGPIGGSQIQVCADDPARFGVVAFGRVAYTGPLSGQWYNGSYTSVPGTVKMTCPANTAPIKVASPYVRSDGINFNPYVYSYAWAYYGAYQSTVTLCVKTDTY